MPLYDYKLYFPNKISGTVEPALLIKNAITLLTITNLVSVTTSDY